MKIDVKLLEIYPRNYPRVFRYYSSIQKSDLLGTTSGVSVRRGSTSDSIGSTSDSLGSPQTIMRNMENLPTESFQESLEKSVKRRFLLERLERLGCLERLELHTTDLSIRFIDLIPSDLFAEAPRCPGRAFRLPRNRHQTPGESAPIPRKWYQFLGGSPRVREDYLIMF